MLKAVKSNLSECQVKIKQNFYRPNFIQTTMSKTIIKSLIVVAIAMIIMPIGVVMAKDSDVNAEVQLTVNEVKPVITSKNNIAEVKDVIGEALTKQAEEKAKAEKAKVNAPDNSKDWSRSPYTMEYVQNRICQVFGKDCKDALIIAKYESGYRPWAISRTQDYGVFQINCPSHKKKVGGDCRKFLDLETNLRIAKQMFDRQGWAPWTTKIYLK